MVEAAFFCVDIVENLSTEIRPHEELVRVDAIFRKWNTRRWWRHFQKPPNETPLSILELVALKHKLAYDSMERMLWSAL